MREYNDGTFGPIREADQKFFDELPGIVNELRAVHFAPTKSMLEAERERLKEGRALQEEVGSLHERVKALENDGIIHKPNRQEMLSVLREQIKIRRQ